MESTPALGEPKRSTGAPTTRADQVVAMSRDVPDLIQRASALDPELARKFTGQALAQSRTPWGNVAGYAVTWLASYYGLGWSPETCAILAGVAVMIFSYIMRYITENPITGFFHRATAAEAIKIMEKKSSESARGDAAGTT